MTDLEDLVRNTLATYEYGSPDGARLLQQVRDRAARDRRRGWAAVGLTAVASGALVVGVTALGPDPQPAAEPPADATPSVDQPTPTSTVTPEAESQTVSYHGVEIVVPASFGIDSMRCGTPMTDTVIIWQGPTTACLEAQPPGLTVVRAGPYEPPGNETAALATESVTVNGQPALRGYGIPPREREVAVLVVPGQEVMITVESPYRELAERILDDVRIATVDSAGCVDHVDPLPPPPTSEQPLSAELVPGSPSAASICRYTGNWVSRSKALDLQELDDLVDLFNALPAGTSKPGPGFFIVPEACVDEVGRGFLVQFTYADGDQVDVHVDITGCTDLFATNGVRTTKLNDQVVSYLLDKVGYDGMFPKPSELQ